MRPRFHVKQWMRSSASLVCLETGRGASILSPPTTSEPFGIGTSPTRFSSRLWRRTPTRVIDLGSGAGFPAIPLALATGAHFDLVEADHRKAAFLREAVRVTGAPASVHAARAEIVSLERAELVTARALAPLPRLLPLVARLLALDGVGIFPKGRGADRELTAASKQWHMRVERFPSRTDPSGVILRISQLSRA